MTLLKMGVKRLHFPTYSWGYVLTSHPDAVLGADTRGHCAASHSVSEFLDTIKTDPVGYSQTSLIRAFLYTSESEHGFWRLFLSFHIQRYFSNLYNSQSEHIEGYQRIIYKRGRTWYVLGFQGKSMVKHIGTLNSVKQLGAERHYQEPNNLIWPNFACIYHGCKKFTSITKLLK